MTKLPQALRGGGTTFMMGRWSAGDALEMVERHRITTLGGIPTQVALMLRHDRFDSTDTSSVRMIAMGGGPSTAALVREARARFGVPVVVRYTCTEAGVGVGTAPDDPPEDAEESVGRARKGVELTVRSDDDDPLPAGELGHVCLRSPAAMRDYWRDPEATAAVFTADGAVRTGDLGFLDERGRLHLSGRSKEMYVRGGYNVFPLEVENVLADHPGVAHVAVVPRPDPVMGEIGVAVVVPRHAGEAPTLEALRAHARGRLASYKLPEEIVLTAELPRTAMEKIDRTALGALVLGYTSAPAMSSSSGVDGSTTAARMASAISSALQHLVAQQALGSPLLEGLGGRLGVPVVGERRGRVAHGHAQDAQARLLRPQSPCQLGQGRLGGAVDAEPRPRRSHRMGGHHHHRVLCRGEVLERGAHHHGRTHQVRRQHLVPQGRRRVGDPDQRRAARHVHQDVDPAHPGGRLGHQGRALGHVGDVTSPRPRLASGGADLGRGLLDQGQSTGRQRHLGPGAAGGDGQGTADARRCPHHQHPTTVETRGRRHWLPPHHVHHACTEGR